MGEEYFAFQAVAKYTVLKNRNFSRHVFIAFCLPLVQWTESLELLYGPVKKIR